MEPLDFSVARPRGPRDMLAGMIFTARVVDKLRAALPGGNLNAFLPFNGFSEIWQKYSGVNLRELHEIVRDARDEAEVEAWLGERTAHIDKAAFNAKLAGFDTARLPEAWRPTFERFYPPEIRDRYTNVLDLLEADDARLYGFDTSG